MDTERELLKLKLEAMQLRSIIGTQGAELERLRVMLLAAQETASREIDRMALDAINKARGL